MSSDVIVVILILAVVAILIIVVFVGFVTFVFIIVEFVFDFLGGEFLALFRAIERPDGLDGDCPTGAIDILRSELKAVEQSIGSLLVDAAVGERAKDLGDGELDGGAILEGGDVNWLGGAGRSLVQAVEASVKVAKGRAFEGGGFAISFRWAGRAGIPGT